MMKFNWAILYLLRLGKKSQFSDRSSPTKGDRTSEVLLKSK
ncbi:MAG: hypothetical protein NWQ28_02750 [Nodularia sp. (in: cyanobacteria)]|nr:hypothetical protein [Nodularia sp. (in: cyanobacteria)]